ncbi:hypothetical protein M747DRAFT_130832 [Aspergillus niger ATCC 13496]|uniref:Uncharacterized protein n=1 Tax=Aspergillus niger ATCC 13496 TaxID=1353008 RepID=A0A370BMD9_ASPNG|nr:hypothetical protein M747DRAFT_130832 [Aspergillus niger ATCC 13496]
MFEFLIIMPPDIRRVHNINKSKTFFSVLPAPSEPVSGFGPLRDRQSCIWVWVVAIIIITLRHSRVHLISLWRASVSSRRTLAQTLFHAPDS